VLRYLALGDSYTIGEGVSEAERWPNHLCAMLRAQGFVMADPLVVARTAWTTDELSDAISQEGVEGRFDLVSLLVGVNDQYRARPVAGFTAEFQSLLARAKSFAGGREGRVVILSIPDWGATPFAEGRDRMLIAREIEAYNESARRLTKKVGAHWIDVTEVSREMRTAPELIAADGLHPSGEMYRRWAEVVLPIAIDALRSV
jgi:lysophospholipase L1-like esterase